jgi:enoyl-CoA hydratase
MSIPSGIIRSEINPPLALIVIEREKDRNRIDSSVIAALDEAFRAVEMNEQARAVILTGSGDEAFSAGSDIAELAALKPEEARRYAERGQSLARRIESLGKPVVAALNGLAAGAGLDLALACALRVASDNARFIFPETKLGFIPGFGGTRRLARIVGTGRALELLLTGDAIGADEAYRIGMINRVVSGGELFSAARELAQRVSNNAPLAIKYCLESLINGLDMPLDDALFLDAALFGLCAATEDMREGTRAYLERRSALFKGK